MTLSLPHAQVITVADFHPIQAHTFAFATSKGAIRLADLRASALADHACRSFEEVRTWSGALDQGSHRCLCAAAPRPHCMRSGRCRAWLVCGSQGQGRNECNLSA